METEEKQTTALPQALDSPPDSLNTVVAPKQVVPMFYKVQKH